jgi:4-carboxymuconolactone decarboxylase
MEAGPRIPPVTGRGDVAPEYQGVVDAVERVFGAVRGPFSMLLHSPLLAGHLLPLVTFNREESIVPQQLRSVAVLAAVREREADYVWAAQVGAARRAGVAETVIDLLRVQGDPAALGADERGLVVFSRQLMRSNRVDPALFDALLARHGRQWLVEMVTAINYYAFLAGITNAFAVPALPDGDRLPPRPEAPTSPDSATGPDSTTSPASLTQQGEIR